MELHQILLLSVVEGVTEFLPISSTAHLILTSHILEIPTSEFLSTFEISIQFGAIMAVAILFFNKIKSDKKLFYKACIAFLPTGILGILLYKYIKSLLTDPFIPVATLFLGGIAIIAIEYYFGRKPKSYSLKPKSLSNMTYKDALVIGLIQSISMIPGVSRSAASIFGGMALSFDRKSAVEFSFLLAIPTMLAATFFDVLQSRDAFTASLAFQLILGIIGAFISALIVIKWLLRFVQTNSFIWFGIYRIIASVVYYLIFLR